MKARFQLFHTQYGETVHVVEMDTELVQPEAGIVDPETLTLRPLKGGGVWTLIPLDTDNRIAALRRLHKVYQAVTTEPIGLPSGILSRMDSLFEAVGLLFDKVKYVVIESKEDAQNLIDTDPPDGYEPKTVEYNILGDMLDDIRAELAAETEPAE